jgi:hypothetical protein
MLESFGSILRSLVKTGALDGRRQDKGRVAGPMTHRYVRTRGRILGQEFDVSAGVLADAVESDLTTILTRVPNVAR